MEKLALLFLTLFAVHTASAEVIAVGMELGEDADGYIEPGPIQPKEYPVKVYVDKTTQTMRVIWPENPRGVTFNVTTGGGKRITANEDPSKRKAYCAETPDIDNRPMGARPGETIKPVHFSKEFPMPDGSGTPMKNAVMIDPARGIYFHQLLESPAYYKQIKNKENKSGGCVRMLPKDSAFFYQLVERYGGLNITIGGHRPQPLEKDGSRCTQDWADRMNARIAKGLNVDSSGEGGFFDGIGNFLTGIFGGGSGYSSNSPSATEASGSTWSSGNWTSQPSTRRGRGGTADDATYCNMNPGAC